ncbi:Hpt domain-containing protein [Spirobacillus cienkowskii]|jgi:HPt (histidine-containing phosphotransfer) domain-containing protein|uniref:Hpt domain-containing protein n=1 Tax=Spirobacillus cienkowskii TaxID=495820 RepID=A0A369KQL2_9BACT|nr:MAG: Hpt domain-containing protein [Spirobacillus cienkowskii]
MSAHINQQTIEGLKMLEEDGEPSFLIDLIETLLKTSPAKLVNIENFLSANDLVAAAKESHSLKSSVRALGADILGGICQRLEDLKSTTNFDDAKKIYIELKAEYEVIAQELTSIKDKMK